MKENYPRYDFHLEYWHVEEEYDIYVESPRLLSGIKEVSFFASRILFIPKIEDIHLNWYPKIPANEDDLCATTKEEARRFLLMLAGDLVVIQNDEWAGETKIIPVEYLHQIAEYWVNRGRIVCIFVSTEDFKKYTRWINALGRRWMKRYTSFSKLRRYQKSLYQLIHDKIIHTPHLSEHELNNICRMRLTNGQVVPLSFIEYYEDLKEIVVSIEAGVHVETEEFKEWVKRKLGNKRLILMDLEVEGKEYDSLRLQGEDIYNEIIEMETMLAKYI